MVRFRFEELYVVFEREAREYLFFSFTYSEYSCRITLIIVTFSFPHSNVEKLCTNTTLNTGTTRDVTAYVSDPDYSVTDLLSKLTHDQDEQAAMNAILASE